MADFFGNIKAGSKKVSIDVVLRSSTNNLEVTGKLAADCTFQYLRQGSLPVSVPLVDLLTVDSQHSAGGWKEIDPINQKGLYRLDLPDESVAVDSDWVTTSITSSGCFVFHERYTLQVDPDQPTTNFAVTNLQPNSNSYVDINYANSYFATRLNTDTWDNSSTQDQQKALIQSTRIIDNLNIAGFKASPTQQLQFPRTTLNPNVNPKYIFYLKNPLDDFEDFDPNNIPTPIIPEDIQIATCEIALALLDERDPDMDYENLRMVSGGMGGSRVTYDPNTQQEHTKAGVPSVTAWRRLRPYLADPHTIELRRVN